MPSHQPLAFLKTPSTMVASLAILASATLGAQIAWAGSAATPTLSAAELASNPLLAPPTTPEALPAYDKIKPEHYLPAFEVALQAARADIAKIIETKTPPTFANTLEALERSGQLLTRVSPVFFTVAGAHATPEIRKIQETVSPKLTQFNNEIYLNPVLFGRVKTLWDARNTLSLSAEQARLLEVIYKRFVRAGAALEAKSRARVAQINEEMTKATLQFGQNLLADQSAGTLYLSRAEVEGLSEEQMQAAAARARADGREGLYRINATRSAVEPFLSVASNRAAREKVFKAFNQRGDNANANNNNPLIVKILQLRQERARLMGMKNHADFVLDDTMAKNQSAAMGLLRQVFDPALVRASQEAADLQKIALRDGVQTLEPWDWRYYAEKLRAERFNIDTAALRDYFPLEGMVNAMIETTTKLFGLTFHERKDVPVYAEGVRVWEIREADGRKVGLFYADWFTRDTKRPGAWMNSLRVPSTLLGNMPIVVNNCNYTLPAAGARALISLDDAQTLFHEFGHALHGLLSKARYPSLSGTAVSRDFVEFPAQIYEHWITDPSILRAHARNSAGEPIPEALLQGLLKARTFNQGFLTVQQLSSAVLDMELHALDTIPDDFDPKAWEARRLAELKVPTAIGMRHRLAHFSHIFDGGYSAGYYSYTWSEVMDADGFDAFVETGDIFNPAIAQKLRREVLEVGNTRDPADSYKAFRGRMPNADALLRNRGLLQTSPVAVTFLP